VLSIGRIAVRLLFDEPGKGARRHQKEFPALKYLLLLYNREGDRPSPQSAEGAALFARYLNVTREMANGGVLVDSAPLQPPTAVTTVRVRDGRPVLTDGPAAEIKEWLGGYTLVECDDLDQALEWAAKIPAAEDACVVVQPLAPTSPS